MYYIGPSWALILGARRALRRAELRGRPLARRAAVSVAAQQRPSIRGALVHVVLAHIAPRQRAEARDLASNPVPHGPPQGLGVHRQQRLQVTLRLLAGTARHARRPARQLQLGEQNLNRKPRERLKRRRQSLLLRRRPDVLQLLHLASTTEAFPSGDQGEALLCAQLLPQSQALSEALDCQSGSSQSPKHAARGTRNAPPR